MITNVQLFRDKNILDVNKFLIFKIVYVGNYM